MSFHVPCEHGVDLTRCHECRRLNADVIVADLAKCGPPCFDDGSCTLCGKSASLDIDDHDTTCVWRRAGAALVSIIPGQPTDLCCLDAGFESALARLPRGAAVAVVDVMTEPCATCARLATHDEAQRTARRLYPVGPATP